MASTNLSETTSDLSVSATPLVSVIVVNWNGEGLLKPCLQSLLEQTYTHREIVLVDNGSTDSSVRLVRALFPEIVIVELPSNAGFTGGNIAGFNASKGDLIFLMNNDARLDRRCLEVLVAAMIHDRHTGICAPKILVEGTTSRLSSAGHGLTTAGVGFNRGSDARAGFYAAPEFVFGACAAATLYRRAMFDDIGFFDEDFFVYDEDADLNCRAQLAGWNCRFMPDAVAYHIGNATSGKLSDCHVYHHTRNLEFVWVKNMPATLMFRYAHHKLAHEIGAFVYLCLRHGRWRPYFRAKRDALLMLPSMIEKRRQAQAKKRTTSKEFGALLTPLFRPEWFGQKARQLVKG